MVCSLAYSIIRSLTLALRVQSKRAFRSQFDSRTSREALFDKHSVLLFPLNRRAHVRLCTLVLDSNLPLVLFVCTATATIMSSASRPFNHRDVSERKKRNNDDVNGASSMATGRPCWAACLEFQLIEPTYHTKEGKLSPSEPTTNRRANYLLLLLLPLKPFTRMA